MKSLPLIALLNTEELLLHRDEVRPWCKFHIVAHQQIAVFIFPHPNLFIPIYLYNNLKVNFLECQTQK